MSFIVNPWGTDNAIQLGCEDIGRQLLFGNNWAKIRVALRVTLPNTGGNIVQPALVVGVSSGTANLFKSNNTTDFLGMRYPCAGSTVSLNNESGLNYISANNASVTQAVRKVGSVETVVNSAQSTNNYFVGNIGYASCHFVDIARVGTAFSVNSWFANTNAYTRLAVSQATYRYDLEKETGTLTSFVGATTTIAITGGAYYDSIFIGWKHSVPMLTIYDISVVRFN